MGKPANLFFIACFCFFFFPAHPVRTAAAAKDATEVPINVGAVLDLETLEGKKGWTSISMAVDEFYASHSNFTSRIILHARDSKNDVVGAASAAIDLLQNVPVQAIIGPSTSSQTEFVAVLGNRSQVPIISFSASSPSISSASTPYFVRATLNDSTQVGSIAAIVQTYGWHEVVLIYEDTEYGSGIVPYLIDDFQSIDARVPYRSVVPPHASDEWIAKELYKLMTMQTRVFVVHMMPALASRLFYQAQAIGLINQGYVWIATDGVTNSLDTFSTSVLSTMEGMIGVRQYMPNSNNHSSFTTRWRARFRSDHPTITEAVEPTVFQLWAYDAAWALALAVEKAGKLNPTFNRPPEAKDNLTILTQLGVSNAGPQFLAAILNTQFNGVSGKFKLVDGQLQSSAFEIVNVIGKGERRIGFWSPEEGISRELNIANSTVELRKVIWPGDSTEVPKGWEIPTNGKKLKIGVPVKDGFNQFVNVETDPVTGRVTVTGYCIDVFDAVMQTLPYGVQYEYEPYENSSVSYDSLVYQVYLQKFDAVVGDTTIVANRSQYVDFTLPYTESGVAMIAPMKEDKSKNAWIFLKPLKTDLWLGSLAFFFFTGFVVWVIEHRINKEFRGTPSQQFGTIFYFSFSTLVYAHKEKLESNLSRFAVIIWVFVVLILTSSYTASLTSMLTVQQLQPAVTDVGQLQKNGDYIGYQAGSFVEGLLKHQLNFDESKMKNYNTTDQYAEALLKGSKNGGVAAIFDELPYLRIFLSDHCSDYAIVGRTFKTDGFSFIFPRGSPLVPDISRAVLNVTEGNTMTAIEKKWFGDQISCPSDSSNFSSSNLSFTNFGGLFIITGAVSLLALLVFFSTFLYKEWNELKTITFQSSIWKRIVAWAQHYDCKDLTSHTFKDEHPICSISNGMGQTRQVLDTTVAHNHDGSQSPFSIISNLSEINFGTSEEGMSPMEIHEPVTGVTSVETTIELADIRVGN